MSWVALETSSRRPSVALRRGDERREITLDGARAHASDLVPTLDRLCAELSCAPGAVEGVLVGTGPGSYTGLRVGIATALGLVRATGAILRGVPSGETLAYGELRPGEECVFLLDARQGELYLAHYRREGDDVAVLRAPAVVAPGDLRRLLPEGVTIFGDETVARAATLTTAERARLRTDAVPHAAALLELGLHRVERSGPQSPDQVEPLYLRPFAAKTRRR